MKTIAVFGATGKTGLPFVKQALEKGFHIRALVRNPEKMSLNHQNLHLIKGDILIANDVNKTIRESDAVVSLIGHVKDSPEDLQVQAMQLIIQSMKSNNIRRLISLTGGGVRDLNNDQPGFVDKMIVFVMKNLAGKGARAALMDGIAHAEVIKNSGLDWTIVRGPVLTDNPPLRTYKAGHVGQYKGFKLTRADLADFILSVIEKESHIKEMPFVIN